AGLRMDATQQIEVSYSEEEDGEDEGGDEREPVAALKVFRNNHIPERDNVLGRDPAFCCASLPVPSVSGRHAVISISVLRPHDRRLGDGEATEALVWDLGSLNGTRKGRLKLTPHVRYALANGDGLVLADLPCQFVGPEGAARLTGEATPHERAAEGKVPPQGDGPGEGSEGRVQNSGEGGASPPPPKCKAELKQNDQALPKTSPQPKKTIVPESDSESEEDKGRWRRRRILGAVSSDLSGPMCSTLLTPANKVIPESEDESSVALPSALAGRSVKSDASSDSRPAPLNFSLDSDTNAEEEEVDMTKGGPAAMATQADLVNPDDFHVDSDTDVEEGEVGKPKVSSGTTPQGSDPEAGVSVETDVKEDCPARTETRAPLGTTAAVEQVLTSPAVLPPVGFRLDSDTDTEDEADRLTGDSRLETPAAGPPELGAGIHVASNSRTEVEKKTAWVTRADSSSDTNDEDPFESRPDETARAPAGEAVRPRSDSDTDLEGDPARAKNPTVSDETLRCAQTVLARPPGERVLHDFRMDSDTDVEEEERMEGEKGCVQAAAWLVQSSTPRGAGLSEEEVETQAFFSPSQTVKRPTLPSPLHTLEVAVAETQSFVSDASLGDATLEETPASQRSPRKQPSRGGSSFCLSLSDSSQQQPESAECALAPGLPEDDWDLQATQAYGGRDVGVGQKLPHLEPTQAYGGRLDQEQEPGEAVQEAIQPLDTLALCRLSAAETQLLAGAREEDSGGPGGAEEEEVELMDSHLSTAETLLLIRSPRQEEQSQLYVLLRTPSLEEEEEEAPSRETGSTGRPCREGPTEPDAHRHVTTAETQPICEDEEKQEEERQTEPRSGRSSRRGGRIATVKPTQALEPVGEDEEVQEEEPRSSRRSRRGWRVESEPTQPIGPDAMSAGGASERKRGRTQEEEEGENSAKVDRRRDGRGRSAGLKSKDEEDGQEQEERAAQEEREEGLRERAERKDQEERGRTERELKERHEGEEKEKEEGERRRREEEEREGIEKERKAREERERLDKEREEEERLEKEQKEREERERIEKEREEEERLEREKKEKEEKLEKERKEREEREREDKLEKEKKEQEEKVQSERERTERKMRGKEKKEREELEQKPEKEKRQQESNARVARGRRKREEQLELELREKRMKTEEEELERHQKENKKREDKEEEEAEMQKRRSQRQRKTLLGRKARELEKEGHQELGEGVPCRGDAQGTSLERATEQGETGNQEREGVKRKTPEEEQEKGDVKPRRGRCQTRKSVVPPAGPESSTPPDHSEGILAKRTRSNSSHSEHFTSVHAEQTRGKGRKTTKVEADNGKPLGKRRAAIVSSSGMEDTLRDSAAGTLSRSTSRSSERSSNVSATQSRGRGGRGMKSELAEEEGPRSVGAGRGRGRGRGRGVQHTPVGDAKVGATYGAHHVKEESGDISGTEASVMSPACSRGRKRAAAPTTGTAGAAQPTPKTPRRSVAAQTHKILFTGVVDEDGEQVVQQLGGGLAKGVADMTHLVTDKVRRTVKFLCAVARGVPIVTPDWLAKSGTTGSFVSPNEYLVKDKEQEKKFNFSLQEALRAAQEKPLLQGYEIHVTPSVKPELPQMKEIITCCGARYLPKMPSTPKTRFKHAKRAPLSASKVGTVVVSCEEDRALCESALSVRVPVVSAEFLLTGILQQRADTHTHALPASSAATPKPSSGGRKK
ncbi:hypothetical protein P4O66_010539, partial [Electrophorus voltai]